MSGQLVVFSISLLLVLCAMPPTIAVLRRSGRLDLPVGRSSHEVPTPRGGGMALTATCGVTCAVLLLLGEGVPAALVAVAAAGGVVGAVEDVVGISVKGRLTLQFLLGLLSAGLVIRASGPDAVTVPALVVVVVFAVWVTGVINATNFMDGINGISGAQGLVCALYFGTLHLWLAEAPDLSHVAAVLGGICAGFLPYNAPRARVFLGDSGSFLLGAFFAVLSSIVFLQTGNLFLAVAPLLPYLADTTATLFSRALRRKRLFEAHRDHAYQRLVVDGGWTHLRAALFVAVLSGACGLCALSTSKGSPLGGRLVAALALVLIGGYLAAPELLRRLAQRRQTEPLRGAA